MLRSVVGVITLGSVCAGAIAAAELKGKIKAMDASQMSLTVTGDDGTDRVFALDKETKVRGPNGLLQRDGIRSPRLKAKTPVMVTYDTRDGKEVGTEIRIVGKKKPAGTEKSKHRDR